MENFLKSADEVASNLKERYKDQWVDPKDDRGAAAEWIMKWNENYLRLRDKDRINNMKYIEIAWLGWSELVL